MNQPGYDPRQGIELFLERKLTGHQLLRCLASYERWVVPADFGNGQPSFLEFGSDGFTHFYMFSDVIAFEQAFNSEGSAIGEHYLELTGDSVWLSFNDSVDDVNINPYSEHPIHYKKDQFATLRRWGRIIRVERVLENVLTKNTGYEILREFDSYQIVTRTDQFGHNLMMAPDSKGRKLAALFTAEDALGAYLEEMQENGWRDLEPLMMSGNRMFDLLLKSPLDGFVFNCCGPVPARAFALAFAQFVVEPSEK